MNEIEMAILRHEQRKHKTEQIEKKESNRISKLFSKVLISVIFLLSCIIYIKLSPENLELFKKNIFESNLTFTKINNWYHNTFGNILPTVKEPEDLAVSKETTLEREPYLNGVKVNTSMTSPIHALSSGILVFMGEKEGYGNTIIVQGVDGVDIWYGNITDTNFKLYDYVESNTVLGNTKENYYYLLFQSDGAYMTYDEYFAKISS